MSSNASVEFGETRKPRQLLIPSRVIGTFLLIFVELMFFSALFSAYFVIKKGRSWELPGHLPQVAAGFNTAVLVMSGISLIFAQRAFDKHKDFQAYRSHAWRALSLGVLFTAFQIFFSVKLVMGGMTMSSSIFGGCYFLLVGVHLFHVLLGLVLLAKLCRGAFKAIDSSLTASILIYWLFVVAVWPVIYGEIYF
jgi:cytochrome c oxidase subunit III